MAQWLHPSTKEDLPAFWAGIFAGRRELEDQSKARRLRACGDHKGAAVPLRRYTNIQHTCFQKHEAGSRSKHIQTKDLQSTIAPMIVCMTQRRNAQHCGSRPRNEPTASPVSQSMSGLRKGRWKQKSYLVPSRRGGWLIGRLGSRYPRLLGYQNDRTKWPTSQSVNPTASDFEVEMDVLELHTVRRGDLGKGGLGV